MSQQPHLLSAGHVSVGETVRGTPKTQAKVLRTRPEVEYPAFRSGPCGPGLSGLYLTISLFIPGPVPGSLGLVVSLNHCVPDSSLWLQPTRLPPSLWLPGVPASPLPRCSLGISGSPAPRWPPGQGSASPEPAPLRAARTASRGRSPAARGGRGLLPGDQCFAAANWVFGPQPERAAWEPAPGVGADGEGLGLARAWGGEGPGPAAVGGRVRGVQWGRNRDIGGLGLGTRKSLRGRWGGIREDRDRGGGEAGGAPGEMG